MNRSRAGQPVVNQIRGKMSRLAACDVEGKSVPLEGEGSVREQGKKGGVDPASRLIVLWGSRMGGGGNPYREYQDNPGA